MVQKKQQRQTTKISGRRDAPISIADLESLDLADWADAFALFGVAVAAPTRGGVRDLTVVASLGDWLKEKATNAAKKAFLEWWAAYLESHMAYDQLDGWITSPFHRADDDEVRARARDQVTALTKKAKEKLIELLRERAKALRAKAKELRQQGQTDKADRVARQAEEFDIAADEIKKGL